MTADCQKYIRGMFSYDTIVKTLLSFSLNCFKYLYFLQGKVERDQTGGDRDSLTNQISYHITIAKQGCYSV